MEEERDKIHLEVTGDGENLIDFSSEDHAPDLSSPLSASRSSLSHRQSSEYQKEPRNFDLMGPLNDGKEAGMTPSNDQDEQLPYLTESSEPERARIKGKCNLRKSLAWDSAFFTSAGVLDPEELSSMIRGADKTEKHTLPGIQEDIRRSTDSISTLESDNLTLENLEVELFEDIRASIQKSSKAFNANGIHGKASSGECQPNSSSKKLGLASQDQVKQKTALRKPNRVLKSQTKQSLKTQGPAKAVKQDSVHLQAAQSVVRTGNSVVTLPKPPRIISKGQPISTVAAKRASLGASQENKIENVKRRIAAVRGAQASKVPVNNDARQLLPKPAASLKSSSLGSLKSTKTESAISSLSDSSGSVSSDRTGKSPLAAARRKVGDRTNPPSSGSTQKTPLKTALKNRTTGKSALSAYLISSKISSSISPASSISEWSSASSTSSSTINQWSNKSRTSFDTISCRSLDNDIRPSDLGNHSNNRIPDVDENERKGFHNESTRKSSTKTRTLSQPGSVKPSGLRMPSPKIGFFDGVKSVRTPSGTMQSHASIPMVLPKSRDAGCSAHSSSNMKAKMGKLPQARTLSAFANIKPSTQKTSSPMFSEERLHASINVSSVSSDVKDGPSLSLEVYGETSGESCLKVEVVGGKGPEQANCASDASSGAGPNVTTNVVATGACYSDVENLNPFVTNDKDERDCKSDIKTNSPAFYRVDDKENGTSGGQADEFKGAPGHVPTICKAGDGHFDEKLEPGSLSFCPNTPHSASRSPLVAMNSVPVSDFLD